MQKGFAPIFLIIGVLVLGILVGGTYYLGSRGKSNPLQIQPSQQSNTKQSSQNSEYQLSGSDVIRVVNGQKSVLFKNVSNVSEVRTGPDGRTVHFKVNNFNSQKPQELCADLESKLDSLTSDYPSPPPQQAPWDYQRIAHYGTIHHCNTYYAGGYLKNSDYFAYLKLTSPTEGQLYYENLKTGELKQVSVKSELLSGFNDGYDAKGTTPGKFNSYWADNLVGKDGYQYFYPHQDSYLQNNYLVLAIGRLVVAVDVQKNNFIGGFAQEGVVATSFHFLSQTSLPFVVVESAWEGPAVFNEIIDVSSGNFKMVNLAELDKRSFLGFKVEPIVWESNSILFNFTNVEDATKKLPSSYDFNNLPINDSAKMTEIDKQAEQLLKKNYGYLDVKCSLEPGMVSGCEGLKKINQYRYSTNEGLVKI